MNAKTFLQTGLNRADIRFDGDRSWDIQVHDDRLYERIVRQGTLGLGETYMDGWWDCEAMDVMFCMAIRAKLEHMLVKSLPVLFTRLRYMLFNLQNVQRAAMVAERHYNFSNQMFACMLGKSMNYSCGYWQQATSLDEAQQAKMDMICQKLKLEPGMHVLDIGCGWGGLAQHMASRYGVDVTAVTVSTEQLAYARDHSGKLPITWLLRDYRHVEGTFDRIVSVGMFEHVGRKNFAAYASAVHRALKADGLFLLHTIGANSLKQGLDPWIAKYIFPNGMLPSVGCIGTFMTSAFIMEDWHNFGADYDKTLMVWCQRFEEGYRQEAFACSERIRRMFRYYLLSCAGAFRARDLQLWQIVLSPEGVSGGYCCRAPLMGGV